jgi:hypothetical protein
MPNVIFFEIEREIIGAPVALKQSSSTRSTEIAYLRTTPKTRRSGYYLWSAP